MTICEGSAEVITLVRSGEFRGSRRRRTHHKPTRHSLQNLLLIQSQLFPMSSFHSLLLQFLECIHLPCGLALAGIHQSKPTFPQNSIHTKVVLGDRHSAGRVSASVATQQNHTRPTFPGISTGGSASRRDCSHSPRTAAHSKLASFPKTNP
jgi:hypothetical protein